MGHSNCVGRLLLLVCLLAIATPNPVPCSVQAQPPAASAEEIDFARARQLMQRKRRGEKLSVDEEAYLARAIAARQRGQRDDRALPVRDKSGLKPLCDMTADDRYAGEDGGLYGAGSNVPPDDHRAAAQAAIAKIEPLDGDGEPAADGRIALVSISMSNATQEFSRFKMLADRDAAKSSNLTIIDCAQGGQAMAEWVDPEAIPWRRADERIRGSGISPKQVQVAWIKLANKGPRGDLQEHGEKLQRDTLAVIHNAKRRFPNLRVAYLGSRIYGGYSGGALNPEPYAYESAFAARWLIRDQIAGDAALNHDAARGEVQAPVLLWGPYCWADGVTPRGDGLAWSREDFAGDGVHPSEAGRTKVATLLLDFFKTDPLAREWFCGPDSSR